MSIREEALDWWSEANHNLRQARKNLEIEEYSVASFLAHQAAEKAVKALLYSVNEAPWGHSIRILLERYFERVGGGDESLLERARELDRHYIPSRYPNVHPAGAAHEAYDEATSINAIRCSEAILSYAIKAIEG